MMGTWLRLSAKRATVLVGVAFLVSIFSVVALSAEAQPTSAIRGDFDPVWTPGGRIAFYRYGKGLHTVNPNGSDLRPLTASGENAAWTRDGRKLAFSRPVARICPQIVTSGGPLVNYEIFVARADGSRAKRLTHHPAPDISPTWSPDGRRLAFAAQRDTGECTAGISTIIVMNENGSGQSRLATGSAPDWSPKGDSIAYAASVLSTEGGGRYIYTVRPDASERKALTTGPGYADDPMFSPDGEKILFTRTGPAITRPGVYVMKKDGTEVRRLAEGYRATWSRDGKQIAFERLKGRMKIHVMSADGSGQRRLLRSPGNTPAKALQPGRSARPSFKGFDLATGELDGTRVLGRTLEEVVAALGAPDYRRGVGARRTVGYRAHPPFSFEIQFKRVAGIFRARSLVLEDVTLAEVRIGRVLRLRAPEIARRILAAYPASSGSPGATPVALQAASVRASRPARAARFASRSGGCRRGGAF